MEEIEVTDPAHPLFGHRFKLLSVHDTSGSLGHVLVSYRSHMTLRVELSATKLTSLAVTELAQLAEQCEVLRAQPTQGRLGEALPGTPDPNRRGDVHDPHGGDR